METTQILLLSRLTAVALLVVYASYLVFQLGTHADIFGSGVCACICIHACHICLLSFCLARLTGADLLSPSPPAVHPVRLFICLSSLYLHACTRLGR